MAIYAVMDNQSGSVWGLGGSEDAAIADYMEHREEDWEDVDIVSPRSSEFRTSGSCQTVMAVVEITPDEAKKYGWQSE